MWCTKLTEIPMPIHMFFSFLLEVFLFLCPKPSVENLFILFARINSVTFDMWTEMTIKTIDHSWETIHDSAADDDKPSDISILDANSVSDDCFNPSQEVELPKCFEFPIEKVSLLYIIGWFHIQIFVTFLIGYWWWYSLSLAPNNSI